MKEDTVILELDFTTNGKARAIAYPKVVQPDTVTVEGVTIHKNDGGGTLDNVLLLYSETMAISGPMAFIPASNVSIRCDYTYQLGGSYQTGRPLGFALVDPILKEPVSGYRVFLALKFKGKL